MVRGVSKSDVAAGVDRRGGGAYLVGQHDQLVVDFLVGRKPLQLFQ